MSIHGGARGTKENSMDSACIFAQAFAAPILTVPHAKADDDNASAFDLATLRTR